MISTYQEQAKKKMYTFLYDYSEMLKLKVKIMKLFNSIKGVQHNVKMFVNQRKIRYKILSDCIFKK